MEGLKERAYAGEKLYGTMVCVFDTPDIAKMLQVCGFDFFVIDGEHGYFDDSRMAAMLLTAKLAGIPAIVRVARPQREIIIKYMEMGAAGLLLPNTETVEQAKMLIEYSKYAKLGNRGVALTKAHTLYEPVKAVEYMEKANKETVLMVQIESPEGVRNINDIMALEGIDCAFIGPNDLSQSLGIMGQFDNPILIEAIEKVITSAKAHSKFSGIHMGDVGKVKGWIEKGMNFNLWSADTVLMMSAARAGLKEFRG
ncbi:MAG: HpcH/HpaI aldolase/citrate lyase family protein [Clostridia bacterium]